MVLTKGKRLTKLSEKSYSQTLKCPAGSRNLQRLDCVIAQNAGHLVRSAVRKLKAISDNSQTHRQQEHIRVEILLSTNL